MAKSSTKSKISKRAIERTLLTEISWEACNQVGGIYTVLRSKVPSIIEKFGDNYCLIGPYINPAVATEFEEDYSDDTPFCQAVKIMQQSGFDVRYGKWLVTGRPNIVLVNPRSFYHKLGEIKYMLWEHHDISIQEGEQLIEDVVAFGGLVKIFFNILANEFASKNKIIAHFHEWMAGIPIPELRLENVPVSIVFTTHATILGRYLAMNDDNFYNHLSFYNWDSEATKFNISTQVKIERAAAHGSHVFTTVSDVTAHECKYLLGREVDLVTPNGINIERFAALHEFQNLHQEYKEKIHEFTIAHFFKSYSFDLDNTLYFYTSGRYEYKNKGFDLTLEALARLNYMMKKENMDKTIVMFFITRAPYESINADVLHSHAMVAELRRTVMSIEQQVGRNLFYTAAEQKDNKLPNLNEFVDDYWKLRFRRTLQSWKTEALPAVVTHNMQNDSNDALLNFIRSSQMINKKEDRVKIVYHPDFISATNPLFGIEYKQFVRGCHLGIFPSYYEPWGYTPLESMASGVPSVTSNLSGFGDYVEKNIPNYEDKGVYVIDRQKQNYDRAASQLARSIFYYLQLDRRHRIELRNSTEAASVNFDWKYLTAYYEQAYNLAIKRVQF
ncbi:MAG TPA: glycogen synthase [Cytophagales bacterium]|jgi:glycogen(starch) synthase|nr:glycogen synthase [Cytophagales bacterium]